MSTKTQTDSTAKAVETKNETLHLVVAPKSNFGQFGYTVSCKLTLDQMITRAAEGLLHVAQRGPASRVEKTIVGYTKREEMGKDWTRSEIAFSDEVARQFETELSKEIEKEIHLKVSVTADQYTPTEREVAYAEAKKVIKGALATKALSRLVKNVGFKGNVTAETALDNIEFVQAVEADRQARNKAMFA